jgi:hypothetical protein
MSPDTIFAQAIEITCDRERAAFLEGACGGDAVRPVPNDRPVQVSTPQ